jgi:hypothetical protein
MKNNIVSNKALKTLAERDCLNPACPGGDGFSLSDGFETPEVEHPAWISRSAFARPNSQFQKVITKQCEVCDHRFDLHYGIGFEYGMAEPSMRLKKITRIDYYV